jgi:sugar-specific transcriptional regulator TrmB
MEILDQLQNLDLNSNEAKTFLAILEIGPASISDIAKRAKIKRPTAYYLIEELIKKGLILKVPSGKRIFYQTIPPKNILNLLENKKQNISKILPDLEALFYAKPTQPKVRFFEGKEGLRNIYEEMLNTSKKVYSIFSFDDFLTIFTEKENEQFFEIIKNAGGVLYDLIKPTPLAKKSVKEESYRKGVTKIKFLPADFKVSIDQLVSGNKVAMVSFKSLAGVIIEDQDIADSQKELITYLWKTIK